MLCMLTIQKRGMFQGRNYRLEVRTPDGTKRFYSIKASSRGKAREEAKSIIHDMVVSFNDERIMWKMVGDTHWTFGVEAKMSIFDKFAYHFLGLEN